ncbi:E3 ubiquitin-protein ligase RNF31 [Astyanax mexicanus]|uniref:E3 ubiquitin-protein ligase RNF31 n=1 Tax=Astyanax mexicanus TaxID=7994 RepID=UPI0020CB3D6B|nr:E3 ubiquitin-protein ligase RNF31 [Astyanax mexicanus]
MASLATQFEDLKKKAESCLSTSGSVQEAKPFITAMAEMAMPLSSRYQHISVDSIISDNISGNQQQEIVDSLNLIVKALSILEKYACNLLNPNRPKYWRTVKFNNPVFKASVDILKGGRNVLMLYGYTFQLEDGLSFPDDVTAPDVHTVSVVATEVMTLKIELDLLSKGIHAHPEFFEKTIPSLQLIEKEKVDQDPVTDAVAIPPVPKPRTGLVAAKTIVPPSDPLKLLSTPDTSMCDICGGKPCVLCQPCGSQTFCQKCDTMVHLHPQKNKHVRSQIRKQEKCGICGIFPVSACCETCAQQLCAQCDTLYHSHPNRAGHKKVNSGVTTPQSVKPCLNTATGSAGPEDSLDWECTSCTVVNLASSVLCEVCERPRLARQATLTQSTRWECQRCTFINVKGDECEMCLAPRENTTAVESKLFIRGFTAPSLRPARDEDVTGNDSQTKLTSIDIQKMDHMREDGLKLLHQLKEGEKRKLDPEEVCAAFQMSNGSNCFDWLQSELPHLLDEICALASSVQPESETEPSGREDQVLLSRTEAKQAWVSSGGNTQKAVANILRNRAEKLRLLRTLGFVDRLACEKALSMSGGDLDGALSHLQRPLLEHFHQNIWKKQPQIYFNINHQDKDRLYRRLLGLYNLPSWGRSQMALTLLQEPDAEYSVEDVIQAVREHHDKDFINRILKKECQICYASFPQRKMQALTFCQCSMCSECFIQHFTVALRDKHIRDMVCPVCEEPEINDPEALETYFFTLDVQLRLNLEPEVYDLFGKKLMEHTLKKDPKFLWCCHCTNGFIYEKDELKVTCQNCRKSFCSKCKKAWEDQHEGLTCNDFQKWKRENDPEYQKQGLVGFLRENGIKCPSCKFQYALAKGGCMHFTCSQCRYEFCCGCNNPFHKKPCPGNQCISKGFHAHHPRDCLYYLRDWEPVRLQALLQKHKVEFNTDHPDGTGNGLCGVMEQKEGGQALDDACGIQVEEGHAGLCDKHYREYLVSLINAHSLDPADLMDKDEIVNTCKRHHIYSEKEEEEDDEAYHNRLQQKLMEIPLGEKVSRTI